MSVSGEGLQRYDGVYLIECSQEDEQYIRNSTAPLAINPVIDFRKKQAEWGTNSWRGEYIEWDETPKIKKIKSSQGPEEIVFSKDNHTLKLIKLTVELFNQKIRSQVAGGQTFNFSNNEELQQFFLSQDFEK